MESRGVSDEESTGHSGPAKRRRIQEPGRQWSGAAQYKTKFQNTWKQAWPFTAPVNDDLHSFHCTVCMKKVSCAHQGERDVARHAQSAQHQKNAKSMKGTQPLNFRPATVQLMKDKVRPGI